MAMEEQQKELLQHHEELHQHHQEWRMTNQTPPPLPTAQDDNPKPTAHVSLAHTIQELRDLISNIALPKTEKAKTVKVPTNTLHASAI